jgi:hypothetical protein
MVIPKYPKDYVLYDNVSKIIESGKKIYNYYNLSLKNKRIDDLNMLYTKLEEFEKGYT